MPAWFLALVLSSSPMSDPELARRVRIESLEVELSGTAGAVVVSPVVLGGQRRRLEFGTARCARRPSPEVLEWLRDAMVRDHPLEVQTEVRKGDDPTECLRGIVLVRP